MQFSLLGLGYPPRLCNNNTYKSVFAFLTIGVWKDIKVATKKVIIDIGKECGIDMFSKLLCFKWFKI